MTVNANHVALKPRISEKTYAQAAKNVYAFDVPIDSNKPIIKAAVEAQFEVTVTNIKSHIKKGKKKRSMRKRNQPLDGARADRKTMYVTLKEGDSIPVFEELN